MKLKIDSSGFTLIELIVVIIIASIFATMMYQFVYTASVRSPEPIFVIDTSLKLSEILENITSDYLQNYTSDLVGLQTKIQNNDYGPYLVIQNNFIQFVNFSEQIDNTGAPEDRTLLKVSIESISSGERLTALYHKQ